MIVDGSQQEIPQKDLPYLQKAVISDIGFQEFLDQDAQLPFPVPKTQVEPQAIKDSWHEEGSSRQGWGIVAHCGTSAKHPKLG